MTRSEIEVKSQEDEKGCWKDKKLVGIIAINYFNPEINLNYVSNVISYHTLNEM